ncbi:MAG TPA: hypothetical protein VKR56_11365 [Candidatus Cybelea sp.]|nr:hypothetical protein [Candidatus Cybelea sp.]
MQTIPVLLVALALNGQNAVTGPDPYADVNAMRTAFSHVRSVVATERFNTGGTVVVKYAAPNRFHITMPRSEISLAGDVEYSKQPGRPWKRSPDGAEHQVLLMAAWQLAGPPELDIRQLFLITSLGSKSVAGAPVRGYQLYDTAGAYDETIWINADDLPVAATITSSEQTISIQYTNYNASTMIAMP